jgi:sec-independent protein translocase protein TatA
LFSGEFAQIGFILFLAFLLFGPKKLPEIARTLGKGLAELRRASNELRSSFEEEIRSLDQPSEGWGGWRRTAEELKSSLEEEPKDVDHPAEGASEPAPAYGHDYSEPAREESGPRS